jgi:2-desacetyl-2-hydroxyethyl bacteriochlorophyllide A dehydrogenase
MKAIVKTRPEPGIEVQERPMPEPGDNEVLIKLQAGSLCGSDLHMYHWELPELAPFINFPVAIGHEFSGQVAKTGKNVDHLAEGDYVTAIPEWACGVCANCRTGRPEFCLDRKHPGMFLFDGFFQEFFCLPTSAHISKLPEKPDIEAFALTEPLAVSLAAVEAAVLEIGCRAAVLGPGPIGLLILQLLRLVSPELLMMTGTSDDTARLEMARKIGADVVVDVNREDPVDKAVSLTGGPLGGGLDLVFEASGHPAAIDQGLKMLKPGGTLIIVAIHSKPAEIDTFSLVVGKKKIQGAFGFELEQWEKAVGLIASGRVDTAALITHRIPISRAQEGFRLAERKEAVKVIFTPE